MYVCLPCSNLKMWILGMLFTQSGLFQYLDSFSFIMLSKIYSFTLFKSVLFWYKIERNFLKTFSLYTSFGSSYFSWKVIPYLTVLWNNSMSNFKTSFKHKSSKFSFETRIINNPHPNIKWVQTPKLNSTKNSLSDAFKNMDTLLNLKHLKVGV